MRDTNISVTCICPGTTDTDFPYRVGVKAKAIKTGEKVSMSPKTVAHIAVKGMMQKKKEIVPAFVWLLPFNLSERTAFKIYQ